MQNLTKPLDDLSELAGGAVQERFQLAMAKVLENIYDVNTEAEKPRTVMIKVQIVPSEHRRTGTMKIEVDTKLQRMTPIHVDTLMGVDEDGCLAIAECIGPQMGLPIDELSENVTPFKKEESK